MRDSVPARPRVLLGDTRSTRYLQKMRELGWGRCVVRDRPAPYTGEFWMLDCGSWLVYARAVAAGVPPGEVTYDWTHFRAQLDAEWQLSLGRLGAKIIVAPDRVGDGLASLVESVNWLHDYWEELDSLAEEEGSIFEERLRAFISREHTPWYLGVQPGITPRDLEGECWRCGREVRRHFSGILLGGTASWKGRHGSTWVRYARAYQMQLHYPRAGTTAKYDHAKEIGADTVDSALPLWTLLRFEQFAAHVVNGALQTSLFS